MIRALVVDDEPLARERLMTLLRKEKGITVIGACADAPSALERIARERPELVFLDIQMPEMTGLELVRRLGRHVPHIVFVTAYAEHAPEAFDLEAVDYLLKPFDRARFQRTLERARARIRSSRDATLTERLERLAASLGHDRHLTRFVIRTAGSVTFVPADEVRHITAEGNYVVLHTAAGTRMVRGTMASVEQRLDPALFLRISRSAIVRIAEVKEMRPHFNGEYVVTLKDGTKVRSGRTYAAAVARLLES